MPLTVDPAPPSLLGMDRRLQPLALAVIAALTMSAVAAHADDSSPLGSPFGTSTTSSTSSFSPAVPISKLANPSSFLDPTRFHMSTEISFGTGLGADGVNGLQVMRFGYQFKAPLAMQVSVGNAFGPNTLSGSNNHLFLEGLNVAYRPFQSMSINVQYRNIRSPLQYGYGPYGYDPYFGYGR